MEGTRINQILECSLIDSVPEECENSLKDGTEIIAQSALYYSGSPLFSLNDNFVLLLFL